MLISSVPNETGHEDCFLSLRHRSIEVDTALLLIKGPLPIFSGFSPAEPSILAQEQPQSCKARHLPKSWLFVPQENAN